MKNPSGVISRKWLPITHSRLFITRPKCPPEPLSHLLYRPTLAFEVCPLSAGASAGQADLQDEISGGLIDITRHLNINAEQLIVRIDPLWTHSIHDGDYCRCSEPLV